MFVPYLTNLMHFSDDVWGFFYYKYTYHCYINGWPLITDEYYARQMAADHDTVAKPSKYYLYEVLDQSKIESVWHYCIPSSIPNELVEREGSRLGMLTTLLKERHEPLELFLEECILDLKQRFNEPLEGFLVIDEAPESLKYLARKHNIPIIYWGDGSLRPPYYRHTAYMSLGSGVYSGSAECERRYQNFLAEMPEKTGWLDNKELLALFLEDGYLDYLRLYDMKPERPITIIGNSVINPVLFVHSLYSDIEVIDDIKKIYNDDFRFRLHPADPYNSDYRLSSNAYDTDRLNPPFVSILKSERIAAIGTNMFFEAMLWGRDVCCKTNLFATSFMCKNRYTPEEYTPVPTSFLNFYCFAFLIPCECAFDPEYLRWRLTNPSEKEIFERHRMVYMSERGISSEILDMPAADRLKSILHARGADTEIAEVPAGLKLFSYTPISYLYDSSGKRYPCLNKTLNGKKIVSEFQFEKPLTVGQYIFQSIPDWSHKTNFISVLQNGEKVQYQWKNGGSGPSVNIALCDDAYTLEVIWEPTPLSSEKGELNQSYLTDLNNVNLRLDAVLNSTSWKITAPIRRIMDLVKSVLRRR